MRTQICAYASAFALFLLPSIAHATDAPSQVQWVGKFSGHGAPAAPWRIVRLDKKVPPTQYTMKKYHGVQGVEAVAKASMALLARPLSIDLRKTPILCWRWRIEAPLVSADMATRAGDDYAARVYVAFDLPRHAMSLATRLKLQLARTIYGEHVPDAAINYVWDNRYKIGTRRANAYTNRTQMIVLRSGASDAQRWVEERRDVLADEKLAFGKAEPTASLLAVATDTDNTGETAQAGFADLHFVPRDMPCQFTP